MKKILIAVVVLLAPTLALAVSPFDPLTTAVSFTDVTAALFTVAAAIVAVMVIIKGIKWVYRMLGR
ncbi:MAG: hypothetical protein A3G20_06425 [Acidobacteria bacterium RIFCSPLOWO2_12_FULL_59_11]|nr:MAG: hypothetical protein A3G20_06425 [Acidobacteria bacterium RIFCSPLOWO2_12_FULL_59_11]